VVKCEPGLGEIKNFYSESKRNKIKIKKLIFFISKKFEIVKK